jgi:hypothetical protein
VVFGEPFLLLLLSCSRLAGPPLFCLCLSLGTALLLPRFTLCCGLPQALWLGPPCLGGALSGTLLLLLGALGGLPLIISLPPLPLHSQFVLALRALCLLRAPPALPLLLHAGLLAAALLEHALALVVFGCLLLPPRPFLD